MDNTYRQGFRAYRSETIASDGTLAPAHGSFIGNHAVDIDKTGIESLLCEIKDQRSVSGHLRPVALYTIDLNGRLSGPRFPRNDIARTLGFDADAFIADCGLWHARIHPDDLLSLRIQLGRIYETNSSSIEYRWRCANGSERIFLDQAVLVRDQFGTPQEIVGACIDVTYRGQLEQPLLLSRKAETAPQITGDIAHDFNNNLSVIVWSLALLGRSLERTDKDSGRAQNALKAASNCQELFCRLSSIAGQRPYRARMIRLRIAITDAARRIRTAIGERFKIEAKALSGPRKTHADPARFASAASLLTKVPSV